MRDFNLREENICYHFSEEVYYLPAIKGEHGANYQLPGETRGTIWPSHSLIAQDLDGAHKAGET